MQQICPSFKTNSSHLWQICQLLWHICTLHEKFTILNTNMPFFTTLTFTTCLVLNLLQNFHTFTFQNFQFFNWKKTVKCSSLPVKDFKSMALTTIGTHCSNLPNGTRNSLRMLSIALVKLSLHVRFKSVQFLIFGRNTLRFSSTPIFT